MQKFLPVILILSMLATGALAASSASLQGTIYYVDQNHPQASDSNPGTEDAPWLTLQYAAETVSPGDEVIVKDGAYTGFRLETGGTVGAYVRFRAAGEGALINADGPTGDGIRLQNVGYVAIEGFRIENVSGRGIAHRGATPDTPVYGLLIRDNLISTTGSEGMYLSEVADSLVENNTITGAGTGGSSLRGHGIYLANAGSDGTTLRGNDISGSLTAGIHFNGDLSVGGDGIISGLLIEDNVIHDNGQNGFNMDGVQDSVIRNNLVYGNDLNGIRAYAIDAAEGPRGLRIVNNTIHVPEDGYWCVRITEDLGDNVVFNNILMNDYPYGGSIALDDTSGFASAHNAVVDRFTPDRSDTILTLQEWQQLGHDAGSFLAQPADIFEDVSIADYRLKARAGAVDAGLTEFAGCTAPADDIVGVKRPAGTAIDVGAYEFVTTLLLRGAPADQAIRLSWTVNTTLPLTSTWQIDYQSGTGTLYVPITGIVSPTRAYTLTGLTNGVWYTVTLNAMLDAIPVLTDTVYVMPADQLMYLPLILRTP